LILRTRGQSVIAFGVMTDEPKSQSSSSWLVAAPAAAPEASRPDDTNWVPVELSSAEPARAPSPEIAQDSWIREGAPAVLAAPRPRRRLRRRRTAGRGHIAAFLLIAAVVAFTGWAVVDDPDDDAATTAVAPIAGRGASPSADERAEEEARRARDASRLDVANAAARRAAVVARRASLRRVRASSRSAATAAPRRPSVARAAPAPALTPRRSTPAPQAQTPRRTVSNSPAPTSSPRAPTTPATNDPAGTPPSSQPGRGGTGG